MTSERQLAFHHRKQPYAMSTERAGLHRWHELNICFLSLLPLLLAINTVLGKNKSQKIELITHTLAYSIDRLGPCPYVPKTKTNPTL